MVSVLNQGGDMLIQNPPKQRPKWKKKIQHHKLKVVEKNVKLW